MAISADTLVPTLTSWVRADELLPGDYVYGPDGLPKKIKSIQKYTPTEMYEVRINGPLAVQGDKHLAFEVETFKYRDQIQAKKTNRRPRNSLKRYDLITLMSKGLRLPKKNNRRSFSIPTTKPIQYRLEDYPIPPFIIGYWYGGTNKQSRLLARGDKQEIVRNKLLDLGYVCKVVAKKHLETTPNILTTLRIHYNEIPKHIPIEYFFGSVEQRLELLRGILLSRETSYHPKTDRYKFNSKNAGLASRVQGLCESLGIKTSVFFSETGNAYSVHFRTDLDLMHKRKPLPGMSGFKRRYIEDIVQVEPKPCVHIETDGTFLAGEGYIALC